ncbi:MAG TPA: DNA mismatch repair protein MutS [Aliiroseovarius sp.]|nr:DNA mismatch repair protein MutS [Aliiroseovarius sp.]
MRARKPRKLRPEEVVLWEKVAARTERLGPVARVEQAAAQAPKRSHTKPDLPDLTHFEVGVTAHRKPAPAKVQSHSIAMDFKSYKKMKGGKIRPEARIDLHGLTLAEAQPRLIGFIIDQARQGRRLVLVITGKGRSGYDDGPMPVRRGVLRHQVPHWLHSAPLKTLVLQTAEANRSHGGQGALYVYLRRQRG